MYFTLKERIQKVFLGKRKLFASQKGSISNYFFYGSTLLILLSIPVTIFLVRTESQQTTQAAQDNSNFSDPPTVDISLASQPILRGDAVTIHLDVPNSNWYTVYYSSIYPLPSLSAQEVIMGNEEKTAESGLQVVYRGSTLKDFSYIPSQTGYVMVTAYQLQGVFGAFHSGDVACMWDGSLYMYRKASVNPILALVDKKDANRGEWDKLTTCQNSGAHKVVVTQ
jgi:hypothetical protein